MRLRSIIYALLLFTGAALPLHADVKLPAIFGDHMVLQRGIKTPFWGWAAPGESVTVTAGQTSATATAGPDGKWALTLNPLPASDQPIDVTIVGKSTLTLHDVLVGDVWICSGQSNMEFALSWSPQKYGGANNAKEAAAQANHPTMRLFLVEHKIAFTPQMDCRGKWVVCTPESAADFSAVGYFFARDILADQHVPVGMIGSYWGGTPAQVWTSLDAIKAQPKLRVMAPELDKWKANLPELMQAYKKTTVPLWKKEHAAWQKEVNEPFQTALKQWDVDAAHAKAAGQPAPPKPKLAKAEPMKPWPPDDSVFPTHAAELYNGMIAPIIPYGIKGAIWYQGESNAGNPKQYAVLFPTMIADWRTRWAQGDFPFIWVQLANFLPREEQPTQSPDGWPGLREAQSKTLSLPNTGQAVIIDIGDALTVHPTDKVDVGHRLALAARHVAYGEPIVYSGPTYDSFQIDGDKVRVKFKNIGSGLTIAASPAPQPDGQDNTPAKELQGFSIAGANHFFVWATATIDGDSVIVSSPEVREPKAVRYGWAANPQVNLYNKEGLPASPFRTDNWSRPGKAAVKSPTTQAGKM